MGSFHHANLGYHSGQFALVYLDVDRLRSHVEQLTATLAELSRTQLGGPPDGGVRCRCGCVVYPKVPRKAQDPPEHTQAVSPAHQIMNKQAVGGAVKLCDPSGPEVARSVQKPATTDHNDAYRPGVSVPPSQYRWELPLALNPWSPIAVEDEEEDEEDEQAAAGEASVASASEEPGCPQAHRKSRRRRKRTPKKHVVPQPCGSDDIDVLLHELAENETVGNDAAVVHPSASEPDHSIEGLEEGAGMHTEPVHSGFVGLEAGAGMHNLSATSKSGTMELTAAAGGCANALTSLSLPHLAKDNFGRVISMSPPIDSTGLHALAGSCEGLCKPQAPSTHETAEERIERRKRELNDELDRMVGRVSHT